MKKRAAGKPSGQKTSPSMNNPNGSTPEKKRDKKIKRNSKGNQGQLGASTNIQHRESDRMRKLLPLNYYVRIRKENYWVRFRREKYFVRFRKTLWFNFQITFTSVQTFLHYLV